MKNNLIRLIALLPILLLVGCETLYFNTMEKVGVHKRDILIDRIEETQASQEDAQDQFKSALEQLRSITNFDGGDLEDLYNNLNDEYEASAEAAADINDRINKVESVAEALFDEWRDELKQYSSTKLRSASASKLKNTERKYKKLIVILRKAERSITPVLNSLKDNSLYLKHNLNARAVASIKGELKSIDADISQLIQQMQRSISESDAFIAQLKS